MNFADLFDDDNGNGGLVLMFSTWMCIALVFFLFLFLFGELGIFCRVVGLIIRGNLHVFEKVVVGGFC